MKIAHYQYVGYPRSGSTFLHGVFRQHPYLQTCTSSVPKEGLYLSLDHYQKTFDKFDYSINMNPLLLFDEYSTVLKSANLVATKFFACIRNPFEMIDSLYTFGSPVKWNESIVKERTNYSQHLLKFQSIVDKPMKLFYFDDLIVNDQEFIKHIYNWLEIPCYQTENLDHIFRNESSKTYYTGRQSNTTAVRTNQEPIVHYNFSDQEIIDINANISKFEQLVNKNFDHWKR